VCRSQLLYQCQINCFGTFQGTYGDPRLNGYYSISGPDRRVNRIGTDSQKLNNNILFLILKCLITKQGKSDLWTDLSVWTSEGRLDGHWSMVNPHFSPDGNKSVKSKKKPEFMKILN
jgi:hypothetical protein